MNNRIQDLGSVAYAIIVFTGPQEPITKPWNKRRLRLLTWIMLPSSTAFLIATKGYIRGVRILNLDARLLYFGGSMKDIIKQLKTIKNEIEKYDDSTKPETYRNDLGEAHYYLESCIQILEEM